MSEKQKKFLLLIPISLLLSVLIGLSASAEVQSTVLFSVYEPRVYDGTGTTAGFLPGTTSFDLTSGNGRSSFMFSLNEMNSDMIAGKTYILSFTVVFAEPVNQFSLSMTCPFASSWDNTKCKIKSFSSSQGSMADLTGVQKASGGNKATLTVDNANQSVFCFQFAFVRSNVVLGAFSADFTFEKLKLVDGVSAAAEYERSQAQNSAGSASGDSNDALGSSGEAASGFLSSVGQLVSTMSTTETNASWTFPAIKIPFIPGLFPEYTLSSEQPINFSSFVSDIPSNIMTVVQSLTTIGLVVFCMKELYSTISYVLTLNFGGGSE